MSNFIEDNSHGFFFIIIFYLLNFVGASENPVTDSTIPVIFMYFFSIFFYLSFNGNNEPPEVANIEE